MRKTRITEFAPSQRNLRLNENSRLDGKNKNNEGIHDFLGAFSDPDFWNLPHWSAIVAVVHAPEKT